MSKPYTIIRGTILVGEHVEPGQIIEADESNENELKQLVRFGKAVEGKKKIGTANPNKSAEIDEKR
jgi:hypothetical protein